MMFHRNRLTILTCILGALLWAATGRAEIRVSSAKELAVALAQAAEGEIILLAAGDYGPLELTGPTRNSLAVTLRSADLSAPARFSSLNIVKTANVTFDGITFAYRSQPGAKPWVTPFQIRDSRNLTLRRCRFDGDLARGADEADNGYGTGIGLAAYQTTDLTVDGNVFFEFFRGLVVSGGDRVVVTDNEVYGIRSDGMNFVAVQSLLVENNRLHDFKASRLSADHADMIQFWTAGTTRPTRDVVIRDNILNSGNGAWTQSILMGNELVSQGLAGPEMFYRNITITGNVIINSHLHGISVGQTDGLMITNNTLIHNRRTDGVADNPVLWIPRINIASDSQNVTVQGNATSDITGPEKRADWASSGNVMIQDTDPAAPGYYDDVFVAALSGDPQTLAPFTYLPGGAVDGVTVGAGRLIAPMPPDQVTALIRTSRDARHVNRFTFDAGFSTGPDGLNNARYLWSFSDGSAVEGPRVSHTFARPGTAEALLTVQSAQGAKAMSAVPLMVPAPDLLHFDPVKGQLLVNHGAGRQALPDIPVVKLPDETGWVMPIGMAGAAISIPHSQLQNLFNTQDFDLELMLKAAPGADPGGEILRIHNSMVLVWQKGKGFGFWLETVGAKPVTIWTRTLRLDPKIWYRIGLHYDATTGIIAVEIDGKLRARGRTSGPLKPDQDRDLNLGNPFGQKSFDGFLAGLDLQSGQAAFAQAPP